MVYTSHLEEILLEAQQHPSHRKPHWGTAKMQWAWNQHYGDWQQDAACSEEYRLNRADVQLWRNLYGDPRQPGSRVFPWPAPPRHPIQRAPLSNVVPVQQVAPVQPVALPAPVVSRPPQETPAERDQLQELLETLAAGQRQQAAAMQPMQQQFQPRQVQRPYLQQPHLQQPHHQRPQRHRPQHQRPQHQRQLQRQQRQRQLQQPRNEVAVQPAPPPVEIRKENTPVAAVPTLNWAQLAVKKKDVAVKNETPRQQIEQGWKEVQRLRNPSVSDWRSEDARRQATNLREHAIKRTKNNRWCPGHGYDLSTGMPYGAVLVASENGYIAVSGPDQKYVKAINEQWNPIFTLEYERIFDYSDPDRPRTLHTIVWIEFSECKYLIHQWNGPALQAWRQLCTDFLLSWSSAETSRHRVMPIHQAWQAYCHHLQQNGMQPLVFSVQRQWPPRAPPVSPTVTPQNYPLPTPAPARPANQVVLPQPLRGVGQPAPATPTTTPNAPGNPTEWERFMQLQAAAAARDQLPDTPEEEDRAE